MSTEQQLENRETLQKLQNGGQIPRIPVKPPETPRRETKWQIVDIFNRTHQPIRDAINGKGKV